MAKYTSAAAVIAIIMVVLRGIFQLSLPLFKEYLDGHMIINLRIYLKSASNSASGKTLFDFTRSLANCLALIIPAVASYFSLKLSLNNYKWLCEHSRDMVTKLRGVNRSVEEVYDSLEITYEMVSQLADDVTDILMDEIDDWYAQMSSKSVTKL